jgi:adenylate cyclase
MPVEIERKFLVKSDAWRPLARASEELCQGYLSPHDKDAKAEVRVRRAGLRGFITIKGKGGMSRAEFEYEIPSTHADVLLKELCRPSLIEKTRHEVEHAGMVWQVDEFRGDHLGLVLAEIELTSVDQAVELPDWIGQDVTDDPTYRNANLAAHPHAWRRQLPRNGNS